MNLLKIKFSGVFEAHLATFLFGLAGLFAKWIQEPSVVIVFGRVFFAALTLYPLIKRFREKLKPASRTDSFYFLILGALLALHWITFFQAIKVSTVAVGLLAYSTFPVFTSVLEPILLKQAFRPLNLMAAALCLFGVFFLIPSFNYQLPIFQGVIWGIIAGFSFSLLTIANRRLTRQYSSFLIAFYQDAG
ncbi:MAG: DMT family transporter, partial [Candidatus Aminicenantes bacterium]|nr:DMT family transporter [Candidatus Aminicenantes bacterium]